MSLFPVQSDLLLGYVLEQITDVDVEQMGESNNMSWLHGQDKNEAAELKIKNDFGKELATAIVQKESIFKLWNVEKKIPQC